MTAHSSNVSTRDAEPREGHEDRLHPDGLALAWVRFSSVGTAELGQRHWVDRNVVEAYFALVDQFASGFGVDLSIAGGVGRYDPERRLVGDGNARERVDLFAVA